MLQHLAEEEVVIMVEDTLLFTVKLRVCRLESHGKQLSDTIKQWSKLEINHPIVWCVIIFSLECG